jgi:hypothetical protein
MKQDPSIPTWGAQNPKHNQNPKTTRSFLPKTLPLVGWVGMVFGMTNILMFFK